VPGAAPRRRHLHRKQRLPRWRGGARLRLQKNRDEERTSIMALNFRTWLTVPRDLAADLEAESKFLDAAFSAWASFDSANLPPRTESERRRYQESWLHGIE
jgi:hypothetical protein